MLTDYSSAARGAALDRVIPGAAAVKRGPGGRILAHLKVGQR